MGRSRSNKPTHGSNGMTQDCRYYQQQDWIDTVAARLGCVAFRPEYHGKSRDGNTVLLYLPEDAEHNRKVDREKFHYSGHDEAKLHGCTNERYIYRPFFWCFANSDEKGLLTFDFANLGQLDLRSRDGWKDVIAGSIELAYFRTMQNRYVAFMGGFAGIREADDTYNDFNIKVIEAFRKAYGKAILGSINPWKKDEPIFREYDGKNTFASNFVVANEDETLTKMIRAWRGDTSLPKSWADADEITNRVKEIHGELLIWY